MSTATSIPSIPWELASGAYSQAFGFPAQQLGGKTFTNPFAIPQIWDVDISPSVLIPPLDLVDVLADAYQFKDYSSVSEFLDKHPYLVSVLIEANLAIRGVFRSDVPIVLNVFDDPEANDVRELFALIQTDLTPEEALRRLTYLDQKWWLDASVRAQCRLNIDVEFI